MVTVYPTGLPGNVHPVSPANQAHVTQALRYRMSWAGIIERGHTRHGPLTEALPEQNRPGGTFGVAGLESQEHSILWFGPPGVIARFRGDPAHTIPWPELSGWGIRAGGWPDSPAWLEFIPATTWTPGGQGIVAEHEFGGAHVVVYELLGRPALLSQRSRTQPVGLVPVVTFHCTRCHMAAGHTERYSSASPADRRMAVLRARKHMRPGQCRGAEAPAWGDAMTATVEHLMRGVLRPDDPAGLHASRCQASEFRPGDPAASSTCAEVREARTHTTHGPPQTQVIADVRLAEAKSRK